MPSEPEVYTISFSFISLSFGRYSSSAYSSFPFPESIALMPLGSIIIGILLLRSLARRTLELKKLTFTTFPI